MAKLFLIGATGFLGGHVLAQALNFGHEIGVLVRDPAKLPPELAKHPSLIVHLGDVLDADSLQRACKRPVNALSICAFFAGIVWSDFSSSGSGLLGLGALELAQLSNQNSITTQQRVRINRLALPPVLFRAKLEYRKV